MDAIKVFQFIIILLFGILILQFIVLKIVEPVYVLLFNRPMFLYGYPFVKRLNDSQKEILEKEFPFYARLSTERKKYFEHRVKEFVCKYEFIGNKIIVTEEMKMLIAGTYVMLTFGMRSYLIGQFSKIILYPANYYSTLNNAYHKGEFNPRMKAIVFSWEDFISGHKTTNDNVNLGLHEFSHALYFHCLKNNDPSAVIFKDEFNEVVKYYKDINLNNELRAKGYFRLYAYKNQFEFLSVILEHFFETPHEFKKYHPRLYAAISSMINFKEDFLEGNSF